MAEVNTDSYPKPTAPVNPLDVAGKLGGLEQQRLGISQQKLDQANQGLQYMTRALTAIGPDGKPEDYLRAGRDAVNAGLVPENQFHIYENKLKSYGTNTKGFYTEALGQMLHGMEALRQHYNPQGYETAQGTRVISTPTGVGARPQEIMQVPRGLPPGQPYVVESGPLAGQPRSLGNEGQPPAPGVAPIPSNRLRVPIPPIAPARPPVPPGAISGVEGPSRNFGGNVLGATAEPPTNPRVPGSSLATGLPPGESALMEAGAKHLAQDRLRASTFQEDVFPLKQALPALEALGTKGTGPGTETINQLKSFILSNVPGVTEQDVASVRDYDTAKKYLTQVALSAGSKNADALAAAFSGNPSTSISNAAAQDVGKSALALRFMQQAIHLEFEQQGLPANQYSRWIAQKVQNTDPRAFAISMMTPDKVKKLRDELQKNPRQAKIFEDSYNLANNLGFGFR